MIVDLSHPVEHGMVTYPGLPAPVVGTYLSRSDSARRYAPGTTFHIGRIELVANTGTYLDAPSHRFAGGDDLAALPLDRCADLDAVLVSAAGPRIDAAFLAGLEAAGPNGGGDGGRGRHGAPRGGGSDGRNDGRNDGPGGDGLAVEGRAVLLRTGWSRHWRTPAYGSPEAPYLSRDGAQWLADRGATLVGIDSVNIDSMADLERPAHTILLGAGIPVLEHLTNLDRLPATGLRLHAAPVGIRDLGTFPVRAYAVVPD